MNLKTYAGKVLKGLLKYFQCAFSTESDRPVAWIIVG
jgi:hypothetical protein